MSQFDFAEIIIQGARVGSFLVISLKNAEEILLRSQFRHNILNLLLKMRKITSILKKLKLIKPEFLGRWFWIIITRF